MRILIIDDDVTSNTLLSEALKEHGHQSDVVESIKDGEYYLDIRHYSLILLNEILADGNPTDSIKKIKQKCSGRVILATQNGHYCYFC